MERDERLDVTSGIGRIVLETLFDRQRFEKTFRCCRISQSRADHLRMGFTSGTLHTPLPALIQETNAQPDVDLHLLFLELTGHTVLDDDIGRVLRIASQRLVA